MQQIRFKSRDRLQSIIDNPTKKKTTLIEWLDYNKHNTDEWDLTYLNFPLEFTWNVADKYWQRRRRQNKPMIGRLTYIHLRARDLFYQRIFLCHQKVCRSFRDIRTVNHVVYPTNRVACEALGLIGGDQEWVSALEEAVVHASSDELRKLFVQILIFCDVSNPLTKTKGKYLMKWSPHYADFINPTDALDIQKQPCNTDDEEQLRNGFSIQSLLDINPRHYKQDIYVAGSENRPSMLNKDNYVPWLSRIIRYARSRPNGKMIVDSIENRPYIRRMIATPGEPDLHVPVLESFHEQINEELTETDIKQMDADDQAIQTILLGLPEDVYAIVDSCEIAKEIWERVRQMMKGSDTGEQEKKTKLFKSLQNIASNLKFLNNLQLEWKRYVTIVRQIKNLHEADFTQIYDFLKMNQDELNELRAERLAKSHEPLSLMAHSQNLFNFPTTHKDQSSSSTHSQQSFTINNKYNPQPSLNQNLMQPSMTSLKDINDPTEAINAALILFSKAFQLTAPTNNNQRTSSNPRNRQIAQPDMNMECGCSEWWKSKWAGSCSRDYKSEWNWIGLYCKKLHCQTKKKGCAYLQTQLLIAQKEEAVIQLQAEEFDFMAAADDLDKIKEVNANYILMENLQYASTSGTQHDKAPVYDTDGSAE
nr:DNA helicase [Tanacetum cinerariifolium]